MNGAAADGRRDDSGGIQANHCTQLAVAIHFGTHHHAGKPEGTQLDFTAWLESLKPMAQIVQILAGLGFITAALAFAKYQIERFYWKRFKQRADAWLTRHVELKERGLEISGPASEEPPAKLGIFREDVLTVVVEGMMSASGFSPLHIQQLLPTALLIVRGMAVDRFLI